MLINAGDIISKSIALYRDNFKIFFQYVLILFIPNAVIVIFATILNFYVEKNAMRGLIGITYLIIVLLVTIVSIWVSIALIKTITNLYLKIKIGTLKEELMNGKKILITSIIATLVSGLVILGGYLLLIIPGIIFTVWFSFVFYAVVLENKKTVEAMKYSKSLVRERWWAVLWRLLAPGVVFLLTIIASQWIVNKPFEYINYIAITES